MHRRSVPIKTCGSSAGLFFAQFQKTQGHLQKKLRSTFFRKLNVMGQLMIWEKTQGIFKGTLKKTSLFS